MEPPPCDVILDAIGDAVPDGFGADLSFNTDDDETVDGEMSPSPSFDEPLVSIYLGPAPVLEPVAGDPSVHPPGVSPDVAPPDIAPADVLPAGLEAFDFGVFHMTPKFPGGIIGAHGGYQASCVFHKKNPKTDCKKYFPIEGPSVEDRRVCMKRLM